MRVGSLSLDAVRGSLKGGNNSDDSLINCECVVFVTVESHLFSNNVLATSELIRWYL